MLSFMNHYKTWAFLSLLATSACSDAADSTSDASDTNSLTGAEAPNTAEDEADMQPDTSGPDVVGDTSEPGTDVPMFRDPQTEPFVPEQESGSWRILDIEPLDCDTRGLAGAAAAALPESFFSNDRAEQASTHSLRLDARPMARGVTDYVTTGDPNREHAVRFSPAALDALSEGFAVEIVTELGGGARCPHTHSVVVRSCFPRQ
jgi:hypothetical protein